MTDSFLEVLRRLSKETSNSSDDKDKESAPPEKKSDDSILAAIRVVRKIVRRKMSSRKDYASDLEQGIVLRLVGWSRKYREKSSEMTSQEWNAFAARTAYNEVNRHFTSEGARELVTLETAGAAAAATALESPEKIEGETPAEVRSLARLVWQDICEMTLRQRRALLLHSDETINHLQQFGGVSDDELGQALEFKASEWDRIKNTLPLSDAQIARLFEPHQNKKGAQILSSSIKKARFEARAGLQKLMNK
jgi:hypothetical protein